MRLCYRQRMLCQAWDRFDNFQAVGEIIYVLQVLDRNYH